MRPYFEASTFLKAKHTFEAMAQAKVDTSNPHEFAVKHTPRTIGTSVRYVKGFKHSPKNSAEKIALTTGSTDLTTCVSDTCPSVRAAWVVIWPAAKAMLAGTSARISPRDTDGVGRTPHLQRHTATTTPKANWAQAMITVACNDFNSILFTILYLTFDAYHMKTYTTNSGKVRLASILTELPTTNVASQN